MYNSLHYTYNLYIVMYYRNIWSLWGKNMTNPENFILSLYRGMNEVSRIVYMVAEMRND